MFCSARNGLGDLKKPAVGIQRIAHGVSGNTPCAKKISGGLGSRAGATVRMPDDGLIAAYGSRKLPGVDLADGFAAELQPAVGILVPHGDVSFHSERRRPAGEVLLPVRSRIQSAQGAPARTPSLSQLR